ncbi:hypothetical protein ACWKTZ_26215 [Bacillus cereus]
MWMLLLLLFIACVFIGYKWGDAQTGFLATPVAWFIMSPIAISIVMSVAFLLMYGWNHWFWIMLTPVLLPIIILGYESLDGFNYAKVYHKHINPIRDKVTSFLEKNYGKEAADDVEISVVFRNITSTSMVKSPPEQLRIDIKIYPEKDEILDLFFPERKNIESQIENILSNDYGIVSVYISYTYAYLKEKEKEE